VEGDFPVAELAFPGSVLAAFEGAADEPVTLEEAGPGRGRGSWSEGGVVRLAEFPTVSPASVQPFPVGEVSLEPVADHFVAAPGEAALTTADGHHRLALTRLQLRGRAGEVVATDGRQLLVQAGFELPRAEDLVVPRVPAFAGRLLAGARPVAVGHNGGRVIVRAGPWSLALAVDASGRYPDARAVVPRPGDRSTRLRLGPKDAALLLKAMPGLPGCDELSRPVTLELGPRVVLRARAEGGGRAEELVLARLEVTGPAVRVATDRRYLLRALRLGLREVECNSGERPAVCGDGQRTFVWMLLGEDSASAPAPVRHQDHADQLPSAAPEAAPDPEPRSTTVAQLSPSR
jgi:hypothetical protein